jgi:hypothetical protein
MRQAIRTLIAADGILRADSVFISDRESEVEPPS